MKKLILGIALIGLVAGCRSTSVKTITDYDKEGKVTQITVTEEAKTPFVNKWVNVFGWGYGFKIVLFDPQSGAYAPCIEAIGGRTGLNTMPVVGENANTYCESLYIEKSMWSNAASVVEYSKVASGVKKEMTPSVSINLTLKPNETTGTSVITDMTGLIPDKIIKK